MDLTENSSRSNQIQSSEETHATTTAPLPTLQPLTLQTKILSSTSNYNQRTQENSPATTLSTVAGNNLGSSFSTYHIATSSTGTRSIPNKVSPCPSSLKMNTTTISCQNDNAARQEHITGDFENGEKRVIDTALSLETHTSSTPSINLTNITTTRPQKTPLAIEEHLEAYETLSNLFKETALHYESTLLLILTRLNSPSSNFCLVCSSSDWYKPFTDKLLCLRSFIKDQASHIHSLESSSPLSTTSLPPSQTFRLRQAKGEAEKAKRERERRTKEVIRKFFDVIVQSELWEIVKGLDSEIKGKLSRAITEGRLENEIYALWGSGRGKQEWRKLVKLHKRSCVKGEGKNIGRGKVNKMKDRCKRLRYLKNKASAKCKEKIKGAGSKIKDLLRREKGRDVPCNTEESDWEDEAYSFLSHSTTEWIRSFKGLQVKRWVGRKLKRSKIRICAYGKFKKEREKRRDDKHADFGELGNAFGRR